jgi:hypothetical protein
MTRKPKLISEEVAELRAENARLLEQLEKEKNNTRDWMEVARQIEAMHTRTPIEEHCREIGQAFGVIWLRRDYLPTEVLNEIGEVVAWVSDKTQWMNDPALLEEVLPILIEHLHHTRSEEAGGADGT